MAGADPNIQAVSQQVSEVINLTKPGNVREFDSCQGNVRDFTEN